MTERQQNPFTTTFSKKPAKTYIEREELYEILDTFSFDDPSESVYKIPGVRGSGKTVGLSIIEEEYRSKENKEKGWLVYALNPTRDMLLQLAASLSQEEFIKLSPKSKSINFSINILGNGLGGGYSATKEDSFFDIGIELKQLIEIAQDNKKKILLSVDDVSKTHPMIEFTHEFGTWLRAGFPVYLVCTGLYENIMELGNVKNLTFFRRAATVQMHPMNRVRMVEMYKRKLNVKGDEARSLSDITNGYAYAFQQLGSLYFRKNKSNKIDEILFELKTSLFSNIYEKIWDELSENDKELLKVMVESRPYKREEFKDILHERMTSFSVYRERLIKRGIITESGYGYISHALPYMDEYIKEYCI